MDFEQDPDFGFLLDLERAVKGLSIGSDTPSIAKLRRLFQQVESDFEPQRAPLEPTSPVK